MAPDSDQSSSSTSATRMSTRAAQPDDFEVIMALYRQLQPNDPVLDDGTDRRVVDAILATRDLHLLVLELDGEVRATAYLNIIPNITRSARPYAIIENVVTDEALRGRRIGQRLIADVLAIAWEQNCYKVMLQTGSKRPSTHHFYRRCGFDGTEKFGYIAHPPGYGKQAHSHSPS